MPVGTMPGPAARETIRTVVRQILDNRVAFATSQWVRVERVGGRYCLHPSASRRRMTGMWSFMQVNRFGHRVVLVWGGDTGDWRDVVRDIIIAELSHRGYVIERDDHNSWLWYIRPSNGWILNAASTPMGGIRMSDSMRAKLREWADAQNCAVSLMFFATRTIDGEVKHAFIQPPVANYLTIRENGNISYLPKGRYEEAESPWRPSGGRQEARPARLLRSMMIPEALASLTDKDWEAFASRIKGAGASSGISIELVSGEDIRYWYHYRQYDDHQPTGDLSGSCMRYDECQPYFNMYVQNPDVCSLAIAKSPRNKLIGRALVWTTVNGDRVYDRVYGNESTRAAMIDWFNGQGIEGAGYDASVQLTNPWHRSYPYMDTMGYITPDGCIHASRPSGEPHAIHYGSTTGGTNLRSGPVKCDICGDVMGWTYPTSAPRCTSCTRREQERIERERIEQLFVNPPASMTYRDYLTLPNGMFSITDDNVLVIERGSASIRYQYHPEAFAGQIDRDVLFTLIPVAVAV